MMRLFPESYGLMGISNGKRILDINTGSYGFNIINEPGIRLKAGGSDNEALLSSSNYPVVGTIGPISLIAFDPQHFYSKPGGSERDWYANDEVKTYATELLEDVFKFDVDMVKCFISSVDFLRQKSDDLLEITQNRQPTKSLEYPSSSLFVKEDLAFAIGGIDTFRTGMRRIDLTKSKFQKELDINIKAWLDYIKAYLNFEAIRVEIVNLTQTDDNRRLLIEWDAFVYSFSKYGPFITSKEQTDQISELRGRVVSLIEKLKTALPIDKQAVFDKLILKGDAACYWSGYYNISVFKQMNEVTYDPEIEDPKLVRSRYYRSLIKKAYPNATSDGIAALLANFYVDTDLNSKSAEGSNGGIPVGEYPGCWNTNIWLDYGGDKLFEEGDPNRDYVVKRGLGLGWWRDTSDGFKRNTNLRSYANYNNKYWYNSDLQIDYMFNGDSSKYKALIKELITKTGDVESLTLEIYHNWAGRSGDRESLRTETAAELTVYLENSAGAPYTEPNTSWVDSEIYKLKGYDRFEHVFPGYVPDKNFGRMDLGLILRALAGITGSRITGLGSSGVAMLPPNYNTYLGNVTRTDDYLLQTNTWRNTLNMKANRPTYTWGSTEGNLIGSSDIGSLQTFVEPSYGVYSGNDLAVQGSKLLTISALQNIFKSLVKELYGVVFNIVSGGPFGVMKSVGSIMGVGADIFQKIAILQNTANTDVLPGIGTNVTFGFTQVNTEVPSNDVSTITSQVFKPKGFVNERTNSMTQTEILSIPVNAVFKSIITISGNSGSSITNTTSKTSSELMRYVSKFIQLRNYIVPEGYPWSDSWSFYSKLSIWPSQINGSFVTSMPYEKYFWRIVNSKTSSVRNYTHFQ
ncbi:MAG: hypothetical protein EOM41_08480 [Bacilli bacterium]|nr:hypothetical protein [Bacilli bacterium]